MSLPWFPFRIDKFLSDTLALDGEAAGGYLFLMLHYYATGAPPRDNDRALATIARLPMDRWLDRRPEIEAFFQIRDGYWHHATIEKEMLEASSKHSKAVDKAVKAATIGAASRAASRKPQAKIPRNQPPSELGAEPEATLEGASRDEHIHLHNTLSLEVDRDAIEEENPSAQPDPEQVEALGIGTPIDPAFKLGENQIAVCRFDGATPEIIAAELTGFIDHYQEQGSFSCDWDATWGKWWKRWKEYTAKQAEAIERKRKRQETTLPARVEVNNVIDWDKHCAFWVKVGRWSRDLGPDPDSPACRCPLEILIKHKLRKESVS